jgi:hypothetical protein
VLLQSAKSADGSNNAAQLVAEALRCCAFFEIAVPESSLKNDAVAPNRAPASVIDSFTERKAITLEITVSRVLSATVRPSSPRHACFASTNSRSQPVGKSVA